MPELSLADLVANRTLSPAMAATLSIAAEERRSFLFVAIPRVAGKTTTMMATLDHAATGTALHDLSLDSGPSLGIPSAPDGGYLVMHEIAETPFPHYLWNEPVRQVFAALRDSDLRLATALHAGSVEEAFGVIVDSNGVPAEEAAQIDVATYIRSLGPDWRNPTRRVVESMQEVIGVEGGRVRTSELHRWDEQSDRFETVNPPQRVARDAALVSRRADELAGSGGGASIADSAGLARRGGA